MDRIAVAAPGALWALLLLPPIWALVLWLRRRRPWAVSSLWPWQDLKPPVRLASLRDPERLLSLLLPSLLVMSLPGLSWWSADVAPPPVRAVLGRLLVRADCIGDPGVAFTAAWLLTAGTVSCGWSPCS